MKKDAKDSTIEYGGNIDNMWQKEKKLDTCLNNRIKYFGSLAGYTAFLKQLVYFCGDPVYEAADIGCGVAVPSINLVDEGIIKHLTLVDKFKKNIRKNQEIIESSYPHLKDRIDFMQQDLYAEPLQEEYDIVLALTVARRNELKKENIKIRNICNAVKEEGYLILSVPLKANGEPFNRYIKCKMHDEVDFIMKHNGIKWLKSCQNEIEIWSVGHKVNPDGL